MNPKILQKSLKLKNKTKTPCHPIVITINFISCFVLSVCFCFFFLNQRNGCLENWLPINVFPQEIHSYHPAVLHWLSTGHPLPDGLHHPLLNLRDLRPCVEMEKGGTLKAARFSLEVEESLQCETW